MDTAPTVMLVALSLFAGIVIGLAYCAWMDWRK